MAAEEKGTLGNNLTPKKCFLKKLNQLYISQTMQGYDQPLL